MSNKKLIFTEFVSIFMNGDANYINIQNLKNNKPDEIILKNLQYYELGETGHHGVLYCDLFDSPIHFIFGAYDSSNSIKLDLCQSNNKIVDGKQKILLTNNGVQVGNGGSFYMYIQFNTYEK